MVICGQKITLIFAQLYMILYYYFVNKDLN